jgi:hypothetical protein
MTIISALVRGRGKRTEPSTPAYITRPCLKKQTKYMQGKYLITDQQPRSICAKLCVLGEVLTPSFDALLLQL